MLTERNHMNHRVGWVTTYAWTWLSQEVTMVDVAWDLCDPPGMIETVRGVALDSLRAEVMRRHWRWLAGVTPADVLRFREKVRHQPPPEDSGLTSYCQIWDAARSRGGGPGRLEYGTFQVGGQGVRAHTFSLLVLGAGMWPEQHADHLCRRTLCVAPDHLEGVPPLVNAARRWGK